MRKEEVGDFASLSKTFFCCQSKTDSSLCENTVKRKRKHNEEARGEKVPQSRDGHSAHRPITAGIFLFGQKEEGWWRRIV